MKKDPQTNEYHIERRTKLDKFREQQDVDDLPVEDFKLGETDREKQKHNRKKHHQKEK